MRRVLALTLAIPAALILAGCPVYPDDPDCFSDSECAPGFACHEPSGTCFPVNGSGGSGGGPSGCDEPKDCGVNETCGKDGRCHIGSCSFHGCVKGFDCKVDDGAWACVPGAAGQAGSGGAGGGAGSGGAAGGSAGDAGSTGTGGQAGSGGAAGAAGAAEDSGSAGATDSGTGSDAGGSLDAGTTDAKAG
jgi:hypothetical protein